MTKLIPRPYQNAASLGLWQWINTRKPGNPLVVMPVGAGKSYQIARFIREVHELYARTRIGVLAHIKELLEQNAEELKREYPECDYDFYCTGLGRKKLHNDVTFASIQSICKKVNALARCFDILIVDECHLISHNEATMYRYFIDALKAINPNILIVGFTGSPFRSDTGRLDEGDGKIFEGIAYEIPIKYMIEQGYLVRPIIPRVETILDATTAAGKSVPMRGGDFAPGALEKAVDIEEKTQACVNEVINLAGNRKRWFGMTAGVLHCQHVRDEFLRSGIDCKMIDGETDNAERRAIIAWFKATPVPNEPPRCLVNVGTMNVGFNAVHIDLLFPMRPTRSPVLYVQYTGRGLRPVYAPGYDLTTQQGRLDAIANSSKPDVMFLDFGDIVSTLGPIDAIDISKKHVKKEDGEKKEGPPPFKICPACGAMCANAQRYCFSCGYAFFDDTINAKADKTAIILSADMPERTAKVMFVEYKKHYKGGDLSQIPSLRVEYVTNQGTFREFVGFESPFIGGRRRAVNWFWDRLPGKDIPDTVDQALLYCGGYEFAGKKMPCYLPTPVTVTVKRNGKYDEIVRVNFGKEEVLNANADAEELSPADSAIKINAEIVYDEIPF